MNELQVKTIEINPAVIKFNHAEIEKELETNLKKYEGLVFTEDGATDLRKTIAELRKGKNAVDRYRIDTKKELNKPVAEFEKKCKQLDEKFEHVINPLVEQQNEFEEARKAEKQAKLEEIRLKHINTHELEESYHERVIIDDSMLTKSASLKQCSDSIEFQVKNLKMEQDKKAADKEIIITTVKLANSENDLNMSSDAYLNLLEFTPIEKVKLMIEDEAENTVIKRKEEQARLEREEQKRILDEQNKIIAEENEKTLQSVMDRAISDSEPVSMVDDISFTDEPSDNPFLSTVEVKSVNPFTKQVKTFNVSYRITATNEELQEINMFLSDKNITFEVVENE